jgi:hypothetical protein
MTQPLKNTLSGLYAIWLVCAVVIGSPTAQADTVAYLVNVTVRPGYNFPSGDDAIAYGRELCGRVGSGQSYADVMASVRVDFGNSDEYQASYLVTQAVNELCPALIWQLRKSAAAHRPSGD